MRSLTRGAAALLTVLMLGAFVPSASEAIQITLNSPSVVDLTSGTADETAPGSQLTITIGIQPEGSETGPIEITGYQIGISWDDTELDLVSATQLFSDQGFQFPSFTQDPTTNGSSAGATASLLGITSLPTTALFSLTFDVLARVNDGASDFSFSAVGDGLAPIAASNLAGASIAIIPEPGTAVLMLLGITVLARRTPRVAA